MFISFFLPLPKAADPLETVHGLWFPSACAPPSYLIKYLRRLMGPRRSRPAGEAPRRRPCMASRRRCEDASAREMQKRGMEAVVRPLRLGRGGDLREGRLPPPPPSAGQLLTLATGGARRPGQQSTPVEVLQKHVSSGAGAMSGSDTAVAAPRREVVLSAVARPRWSSGGD